MQDFLDVARALTDENRVRALMALRFREMCVCQITALLDLAPSTTSKHLTGLRRARLIEARKKGKWVYYRMASPDRAPPRVAAALDWVVATLDRDPVVLADRARIRDVLEREGPEDGGGGGRDGAGGGVHADCGHSPEIHTLARDLESDGPDESNESNESNEECVR